MLFYTEQLTTALRERFNDVDEMRDIAFHGCEGGISGFIYYEEVKDFFYKYEDDIEDVCFDILGEDFLRQLSKNETCLLGLIQRMVWFVVEAYCHNMVHHLESCAVVA